MKKILVVLALAASLAATACPAFAKAAKVKGVVVTGDSPQLPSAIGWVIEAAEGVIEAAEGETEVVERGRLNQRPIQIQQ